MTNIEFFSASKGKWYEQIPLEFFLQIIPGLGFAAVIWFWSKLNVLQRITLMFASLAYSCLAYEGIHQLFK